MTLHPMRRLAAAIVTACLLSVGALGWAHSPMDSLGRTFPAPATAAEVADYAKLLGAQPTQAVTFGEDMAVAVVPATNGQQELAAIGLYLKTVHRMPDALGPEQRISDIHLRGDIIAFRVEAPAGAYDYLWDAEEPGPPFWKLTAARSGTVTYSPNVAGNLVATFYLRDPQSTAKLAQADALRKARGLGDVEYIDGAVLLLAAAKAGESLAFRWMRGKWADAGTVPGVVNHHAMADLNGDGLIEVLAGDIDATDACNHSWSALYTWNAAKTRVLATLVRAESANNLSGKCAEPLPACFRRESLSWDRAAKPRAVVKIEGSQDTTGCPGAASPAGKKTYQRHFAWDAKRGAFQSLAD
jgi:hypothetical protein